MSRRQSKYVEVDEIDFDELFKNAKPYLNPTLAKTASEKLDQVNAIEGDLKREMGNLGAKNYATNCPKCQKTIGKNDAMIQAVGFRYHPECFTCETCKKVIGENPFIEQDGKIYCPPDHAKLYSSKCADCGKVITEHIVRALGTTWHADHLKCAHCKSVVGNGFLEKDGKAYCRRDYIQLFLAVCASCKLPIEGSFYNALNKKWHEQCYNCQTCHQPFNGQAFPFGDLPYCEKHFHEKNKSICSKCSNPIVGQCIRAIERSYHPQCFSCHVCNVKLSNEFYDVDGFPHCATHGEFE